MSPLIDIEGGFLDSSNLSCTGPVRGGPDAWRLRHAVGERRGVVTDLLTCLVLGEMMPIVCLCRGCRG